jgi:hypothetical protein
MITASVSVVMTIEADGGEGDSSASHVMRSDATTAAVMRLILDLRKCPFS